MLCPALDYVECPSDPRGCQETCQLQPDPEE